MLGWEFPPFNSGGLGTACAGLAKGLTSQGVNVTFVLPKASGEAKCSHVNLIVADRVYIDSDRLKLLEVNSLLVPYITSEAYEKAYASRPHLRQAHMHDSHEELYGRNLFEEVQRYSEKVRLIAALEDFDVIHAHDWMTYPAAIKARQQSGKPMVVHIHATEFDRTGGHVNQYVYDVEREGFHAADRIIAVSSYTKGKVVMHYGISPDKVEVVHNAVEFCDDSQSGEIRKTDKIVLFLGRITLQKGPEYFVYAAKRVLDVDPDVKFVMAGSGDMERYVIEEAARLGIGSRVLFTGFLRGPDIDRAYRMADLYVMPSVSEPFGITPLEAMRNGTPCLISRDAGVSEVISHCLKIDFWDIEQMSSKILAALRYRSLHRELSENGSREVRKFNWSEPARRCTHIYSSLQGYAGVQGYASALRG